MTEIRYEPLSAEQLAPDALDNYVRYQEVQEVWRCFGGEWRLIQNPYSFDWSPERRREIVQEIKHVLQAGGKAYGAFDGDALIGFSLLSMKPFGSRNHYTVLKLLQISAHHRGLGIGRRLFTMAADTAREAGFEKLYISANCSKESQAAYRRFGCVYATEIDEAQVKAEPFDVQIEYIL